MSSSGFLCGKWLFPATFLGTQLHPCVSPRCILVLEELVSLEKRECLDLIIPHFNVFFFKISAPEIEPQSPISITCPIIQLGLFYSINSPGDGDSVQLGPLQLSSLLWRFALGEREKELFWMETGKKTFLGQLILCLGSQKWGVHRNPFSSCKSGWVYSKQEIGRVCSCSFTFPGFELWLLVPLWGHCPSGRWHLHGPSSAFSMFGFWTSSPWGFSSMGF